MFFSDKRFRQLAWIVHEMKLRFDFNMEAWMSANADAIEGLVQALKDAETRISDKLTALQTAVDNGEDLSTPLADLTAEVGTIGGIVPAAVAAAPVTDPSAPVVDPSAPATDATPAS